MAAFLVYFRISYRVLKDAHMPVMSTMLNENDEDEDELDDALDSMPV